MAVREWADDEYSRIYWTVVDDPKFADVFYDDRRWAAYTRLLMAAEATYPSAAPLPRWLADDVLDHLCAVRIVEKVGDNSYRIVGLRAEREGRLSGRAVGGRVRALTAERDGLGHFLRVMSDPANTQQNTQQNNAGSSNGTQQPQQTPASDPASDPANNAGPAGTGPAYPAKTRTRTSRERELVKATSSESEDRARGNGAVPDRSDVTLSKAEHDAWQSFGREWDAVKAAWIGRGLRLPPSGSAEGDDTSQRGLLWQVLNAQPTNLVRWIREAKGRTARDVVTHVLSQWHGVRTEAGIDDPPGNEAGPDRTEAAALYALFEARS